MIRALFLSHDSSLYGAQLSLLGLLSKLDRDEIDPMVVAPHEGPLNDAITKLGIPVVIRRAVHWIAAGSNARKSAPQIGRECLSGLKPRTQDLARLIEDQQIDVVYTNTVVPIEGALAARLTRRPHIWHLREQVAGNSQLKAPVPSWLIPFIIGGLSSRVIVNSRHLGQAYARGPIRHKLEVIYNGVDPAPFDLDRGEAARSLRVELGLASATRLVVLIGAVIPNKGPMLFAQAAARLRQRFPEATYLVVGKGEAGYISQIQAFCDSEGMQERLLFLGWRPDIPRILAAAELLVVAAEEESFGRTVIEAMATGTPVVSTRCGGPEEIVLDKYTGLLVSKNDPAALAQAIAHILGDPVDATRMAAAGRERLHEVFTLESHAHKVQSLIAKVVRSHKTVNH